MSEPFSLDSLPAPDTDRMPGDPEGKLASRRGMGGQETIKRLQEIDPDVRAIVSSGYSSDLAMSDFRQHGFRGMVAKPYDINELATVIRSVLAEV